MLSVIIIIQDITFSITTNFKNIYEINRVTTETTVTQNLDENNLQPTS